MKLRDSVKLLFTIGGVGSIIAGAFVALSFTVVPFMFVPAAIILPISISCLSAGFFTQLMHRKELREEKEYGKLVRESKQGTEKIMEHVYEYRKENSKRENLTQNQYEQKVIENVRKIKKDLKNNDLQK